MKDTISSALGDQHRTLHIPMHRSGRAKTWAGMTSLFLGLFVTTAVAAESLTAKQVIERYMTAMGGADALAKIQSRDIDGEIKVGWVTLTTHSRLERPNLFEDSAKILGMTGGSGHDGTRGWTRKGSDVKLLDADDLKRAIRSHSLDWNLQFDRWYPTQALVPSRIVGGRTLHCVETVSETSDRETWCFDAETGLLQRFEGHAKNEEGKFVPVVANFSDYRMIDGVMIPFRMEGSNDGKKVVAVTTRIEHNRPGAPVRFPDEE